MLKCSYHPTVEYADANTWESATRMIEMLIGDNITDQTITLATANDTLTIRVIIANHRAALSADTFVGGCTLKKICYPEKKRCFSDTQTIITVKLKDKF